MIPNQLDNPVHVRLVLIDFGQGDSWLFSKLKQTMRLLENNSKIAEWIQAELIDINGDFERVITNVEHPNNRLLNWRSKSRDASCNSLKDQSKLFEFFDYKLLLPIKQLVGSVWSFLQTNFTSIEISKEPTFYTFEKGEDDLIHPQHGVVFKGDYRYNHTWLMPSLGLFNPTGFTILLRLFCEEGSSNVISFGPGSRWFVIKHYGILLNNHSKNFFFKEPLKIGAWNNVYLSYNNAQSPVPSSESSGFFQHHNPNSKREIFCIVNGDEHHFDVDVNIDIFRSDEFGIHHQLEIHFLDYCNSDTFKGFFSSLILFNQSCTSAQELKWLASTFLKYHKKPTVTYQQILNDFQ